MPQQLPSGQWRGRVRHPDGGKQIAPHTIIGGPKTYPSRRAAQRAEDTARDKLVDAAERGATVCEWRDEWTTSKLWQRPAESTNAHNRERVRAFVETYGDRPMRSIDHRDVRERSSPSTRGPISAFDRHAGAKTRSPRRKATSRA
jgi:hypothetical protein